VDISSYVFDRLMNNITVNKTNDVFILDDQHNLLSSINNEKVFDENYLESIKKEISDSTEEFVIIKKSNTSYYLSWIKFNNNNWTLVYLIDKQNISNDFNNIILFTAGIIIIL